MKNQVKIYRNKLRDVQSNPQDHYVPNYQLLGIDPEDLRSAHAGEATSGVVPVRPKPVRVHTYVTQPYAEEAEPLVGPGSVPNVGNNMEHTWSSVDGEIVDDLPTSPDAAQGFIDNNEYVTPAALGQPSFGNNVRNRNPLSNSVSSEDAREVPPPPLYFSPIDEEYSPEPPADEDLLSVVSDLDPDTYLLIVNGAAICSGPLQEIEEETSALVLGNHVMFGGRPIPEEEIIVLKKVKVKVGVFLS